MSARFRPPRSPTPRRGGWRSAPEAAGPQPAPGPQQPLGERVVDESQPPSGSQRPPAEPVLDASQRPIGSPWPTAGDGSSPSGDGEQPRRGLIARSRGRLTLIGVVIAVAFVGGLTFSSDRWSEAELEGDLAATLQRHDVVATSTRCTRHDQTVICTIRTSTPEVPPEFTVTGDIEVISRRRSADDDGDVEWKIPPQVIAP